MVFLLFFLRCRLAGNSEQLFIPAGRLTTGTIVHAGGWTAGGGSPDPEAPRTIVRYPAPDKPDPDPIHRGFTCLKPNNSPISPDPAPIKLPIRTTLRSPCLHPFQVNMLFYGFHATLLYQVWVFMGGCGYFHAFLGYVLKFL